MYCVVDPHKMMEQLYAQHINLLVTIIKYFNN